MQIVAECKLCKEIKELQLSHIIPKFIGRWLKKTSATGYIRNVVKANQRIQDLPKQYLLCKDCEKLFSGFETKFAENIFYPFHNENRKLFHYDTWLQKFIVSLNWRVAISGMNNKLPNNHPSYFHLENTLETWRRFLLDEINNPGRNKNHIIFIGIVDMNDFYKVKFTHEMNIKFLRSVDFATVIDNEERIFVYSALAGILFVSHIYPTSFKGWTNQTKVTKRGTLKNLQNCHDYTFGSFLTERLYSINHMIESLSQKQENLIYKEALLDIEKSMKSKSFGLMNQLIKIVPPEPSSK
jgi:hypothetical protein